MLINNLLINSVLENASDAFDPYSITYHSYNAISFRDNKIYFPFECYQLFHILTNLGEKLLNKNVCATDLQSYPQKIFEETELNRFYDLAAWVYNIIEVWVTDIEDKRNDGKKNRLFDSFLSLCENKALAVKKTSNPEFNLAFEEIFNNQSNAEPCLNILRKMTPPVIDAYDNYIGNNKGIFPLWIKILKTYQFPLIKHFKDSVYKDVLNAKIKGLNLSKDASEFRKVYKRLKKNEIELDIRENLSQLSQSGKLGI